MATGNSFADAVRATARLRSAVLSGAIGATVACTMAYGALAADSAYAASQPRTDGTGYASVGYDQGDLDLTRQNAGYFLKGLNTIAKADLSSLSPREAVLTLKAMARNTLEHGPKPPSDPFEAKPDVPGARNVEAMTAFLTRLSEQATLPAGMVQEEAGGTARKAMADLKRQGMEPAYGEYGFGDVVTEMANTAKTKAGALRDILANSSDPEVDIGDLVERALEAEEERAPAESVLLYRLADRYIASEDLSAAERSDLSRSAAVAQVADGGLGAIRRMFKEEGTDLQRERLGRVASLALSNVAAIEKAHEAAMENAPRESAPGR